MQPVPCAFCLALARAGRSIAARMAMMAITTNSSISVKADLCEQEAELSQARLELFIIAYMPCNRKQCGTEKKIAPRRVECQCTACRNNYDTCLRNTYFTSRFVKEARALAAAA